MNNEKLMQDILNHPERINLIYTPALSSMFISANHIYGANLIADVVHVGETTLFFMMEDAGATVIDDWYNTGADLTVLPKILDYIASITVYPMLVLRGDTDLGKLTVYAIAKSAPKRTLAKKDIEGLNPAGRLIIDQASWQIETAYFDPDMFSLSVHDFDADSAILHSVDGTEMSRRWASTLVESEKAYQEIEDDTLTTLQ